VKITNLEKKNGTFFLKIDSFELPGPGIYGLIGPNGCGKTTTAKLIMNILRPDRGIVALQGLSVRDITMLPQEPYILNDTVYRNLIYPLQVRRIRPDPRLCDEYLDRIGFLTRRNQRALSLSGGERQKLAMLRALIFEPRLVIVDEALTDLDMDSLDMFERMILDIQKKRPLIWLLISHHLPHIRRLCEYVFFMYNGSLEAQGPAPEIFECPRSPRQQRYLNHEIVIGRQ
jgi:ABC-type multidrug transport system ATPase subunit